MATWTNLDKPANEYEQTCYEFWRDNLPDNYAIYSNLSISRNRDLNCEIDCFLITAKGLYVIEIKRGDQPIKGRWDGFDRNPLNQADENAKIILSKLRNWSEGLTKINVKFLVCLTGSNRPSLEKLAEDGKRKRRIVWYKDLPDYLNRQPSDNSFNLYLQSVRQAIESNFSRQYERIGGYQILGEAWKGSLYTAYYARGDAYPYQYLLKVYEAPKQVKDANIRDFLHEVNRELDAIKRIANAGNPASGGSKNVVVGETAFLSRGEYIVAMQWVSGRPLTELIGHQSLLSLDQKCRIAAQICRGVAFAHSAGNGVLHRNLHPGNIIYDRTGNVKIINFDFAKFMDPQVHHNKTLLGDERTLAAWLKEQNQRRQYVAPEILQNGNNSTLGESPRYANASKESDTYSVGVILWELFAGYSMPDTRTPEIMEQSLINSGLKQSVLRAILQMCSKNKSDRDIDLIAVADSFEALTTGEKFFELPDLKPGSIFKEYPILSRLASTDMSVTYLAHDKLGEGKVTIKFLKTNNPEGALEETKRVRELSRKLQSTGRCASWMDGGFVNGNAQKQRVYYQVMEYIEGESLKEVIWKPDHPDSAEIVRLCLNIIRCVKVVHEAEWTHRDIKPANFILTPQRQVKIIDFGLSRRIEEPSHVHAISPGYTPPEVMPTTDGPKLGEWSYQGDVYSTACVIASLLCGEKMDALNGPAFDEELIMQMVPEWKDLLTKDMSKDPLQRCHSAVEMLNRYEAALDDSNSQQLLEIDNLRLKQALMDKMFEYPPNSPELRHTMATISLLDRALSGETVDIPNLAELGMDIHDFQQVASTSNVVASGPGNSTKDIDTKVEVPSAVTLPNTEAEEQRGKIRVSAESNREKQIYDGEKVIHKPEKKYKSGITTDAKLLDLKLQERDDVIALEEAIREAEMLKRHGKLPDALMETLTTARQYFDATRSRASQALTMARTGNVCESWWGVQILRATKGLTVRNEVTGEEILVVDALKEAELEWAAKSNATLDDLENYRAKFPYRPDLVADHLLKMQDVTDPDGVSRKIVDVLDPEVGEKWRQLGELITNEKASFDLAMRESELGEIEREHEKFFKAYKHFSTAQKHFDLENISEKIDEVYFPAKKEILDAFNELISSAKSRANEIVENGENFGEAQAQVTQALEYLTAWEGIAEKLLQEERDSAGQTSELIVTLKQEFDAVNTTLVRINNILDQKTIDSNTLNIQAHDLEEVQRRINANQPLAVFFKNILDNLYGKLSSKKGIDAAKEYAKEQSKPEKKAWSAVIGALQAYKDVDDEARRLYEHAMMEQRIDEIRISVHERNIRRAYELAKDLPEQLKSGKLSRSWRIIQDARGQDRNFEKFYQQAQRKKDSPRVSERCEAYAIYAVLSGNDLPVKSHPKAMPEYALSSFTFDANGTYQSLRANLQKILDPLVEQFEAQQELYAPVTIAETWHEQARSLRRVGLLDERQLAAACWAEAGFAYSRETLNLFVWEELADSDAYPTDKYEAVRKGLLKARSNQAVDEAGKILDPDKRIGYIQKVQEEKSDLVGDIGLLICLARTYAEKKDFKGALDRLNISLDDRLEDEVKRVLDERLQLEVEKAVWEITERAVELSNQAQQESVPREAQRLWREALDTLSATPEVAKNDIRVGTLATKIFVLARKQLEVEIRQQFTAGEKLSGVLGLIALILLNQSGRSALVDTTIDAEIDNPAAEVAERLGDSDFVDEVLLALTNLAKRVDPREQAFDWKETPAGILLKVVEDVQEQIILVMEYLNGNSAYLELDNTVASLAQVRLELRKLIFRPDRYLYQHPWQDAVLYPLAESSREWKEAVQLNNFAPFDSIYRNALQSRGILSRVFEGTRFKVKLDDCKLATSVLRQMAAVIYDLYDHDKFSGVVRIIDWLSNPVPNDQAESLTNQSRSPVPWMKPVKITSKVASAIDWNLIGTEDMQGILAWLKILTGWNITLPAPKIPAELSVQNLSAEDYDQILTWRSAVLNVYYQPPDGTERKISGWKNVRQDAHNRSENLLTWENLFSTAAEQGGKTWLAYELARLWSDERLPWREKPLSDGKKILWKQQYDAAKAEHALFPYGEEWLEQLVGITNAESKFRVCSITDGVDFTAQPTIEQKLPRTYRLWFWEHANENLLNVVNFIGYGLVDKNENKPADGKFILEDTPLSTFPVLSSTALKKKEDLQKVFKQYHEALEISGRKVEVLKAAEKFPAESTIKKARRENKTQFRKLLEIAREAGPATRDQSKVYWVYKQLLEPQSLWKLLFG